MKELLTTKNVFLVVLFLGLFAMAARNVTDPDLWWHLKTGQFIVAHKSVPRSDPFSYTRAGAPWVAHEWLSEVLLYELERTTGWGGLIAVFAAALCAAFFLLYLRCGPNVYVAGLATLCAAWATMPVWGVRPQVLSVLLTSLWLLILERSERKPKLLWWTSSTHASLGESACRLRSRLGSIRIVPRGGTDRKRAGTDTEYSPAAKNGAHVLARSVIGALESQWPADVLVSD